MFETIKNLIVDQLEVKDPSGITLDTSIHDDLGADSLDAVEIIMGLEDHFNVEIPDEIAEKFEKIGDIVTYLTQITK
ncbi:MAG: acyl carrier protein [Acidaminobacteraceae bacterium]